jgi:hypothetical protein
MTAQFHEGQEVEVHGIYFKPGQTSREIAWRKAKIARMAPDGGAIFNPVYEVQFPDGSRSLFDAFHIRPLASAECQP